MEQRNARLVQMVWRLNELPTHRVYVVGPKGFSWFGCWNHFEPSTSAMPSCLRVSSLLKFVIPFQVRKPVKVWSSGALGGYFPCRHPWLESATFTLLRVYGPTFGKTGSAPNTHKKRLPIWLMAGCGITGIIPYARILAAKLVKDRDHREDEYWQDDVLQRRNATSCRSLHLPIHNQETEPWSSKCQGNLRVQRTWCKG